jgi:hypothetical protein
LIACGHIRHAWSCSACGNGFETAVRLPADEDGDRTAD